MTFPRESSAKFQPIHPGHLQIRQQQINGTGMIMGYFQCGLATAGSQNRESISLEQFPDEKLDVNFVFYEHYDHRFALASLQQGSDSGTVQGHRFAHRTEMRFNRLVMTTG